MATVTAIEVTANELHAVRRLAGWSLYNPAGVTVHLRLLHGEDGPVLVDLSIPAADGSTEMLPGGQIDTPGGVYVQKVGGGGAQGVLYDGGGQPADSCGVVADHHEGDLYRVVLTLQPQLGAGLPFRFTEPIWQEQATICHYHLYPPEYETPPVPPEGWTPPLYRIGVACNEGLPVRLIWTGEIVE